MAVGIVQTANVAGGASVSSVVTFTGAAIGTASTDRIVVVCSLTSSTSVPQSATIGGVTMNKTTNGIFGSQSSTLFYLNVAAGTTADIAVTYNGAVSANASSIVVYAVTGATATPIVVGGGNGSTDCDVTAPLTTGSITIPSSGGFVAAANVASNTSTTTWANATVDVNAAHIGFTYSTATRTTALTTTAVTCTGSVNNADGALGWLVFGPGLWLTPAAGALTLSGVTPTLAQTTNVFAQPAAAALALTTSAPTLTIPFVNGQYDETGETGNLTTPACRYTELEFGLILDSANLADGDTLDFRLFFNGQLLQSYLVTPRITAVVAKSLVPAAGALALSGAAPTVSQGVTLAPSAAALSLAGTTSTVSTGIVCIPSVGTATLAPNALVLDFGILASAASLSLAGVAPSEVIGSVASPSAASLSLTTDAPTLSVGGGANDFVPGVADLTLAGPAPIVVATDNKELAPGAGSVALTATAPIVSTDVRLQPSSAAAMLVATAPTVSFGAVSASAALSLTGDAPGVSAGNVRFPAAAALQVTGVAPTVAATQNIFVSPPVASISLTAVAPSRVLDNRLSPDAAVINLTGSGPELVSDIRFYPPAAALDLSGPAPLGTLEFFLGPTDGQILLTGNAPAIAIARRGMPDSRICDIGFAMRMGDVGANWATGDAGITMDQGAVETEMGCH